MADITIAAINELKALPAELHWFCSRSADDENDRCYDEDHTLQELSAETEDEKKARKERADAAGKRKATVLNAVLIFAFDGSEAIPLQEWVAQRLDHLMHQCDVCVRTFHASRVELKEKLDADYDEEDVVAFLDKFDGVNVERIKRGLQHAERQLLHLAPEKRRVGSLDPEGLYALFEAMNCEPYLRNEHLMRSTFDQPFRLVQTTKKLRLPTFLPAHTYFIFSADKERQEWAAFAWSKLARPPTSHEFDYMIKKPLELALRRVQMQALEVAFLPDFYYGVNVVVSKLTADLIMHSLRPMEGNLIRLALDQFSLKDLDVSTFVSLCSMWKNLLEKSPEAFWDSMRSIPATSIVEQCFKSPALGEILMRPTAEGMPRMEDVFAWIQPFLASIKGNQVTACGALVREFVSRSKNDHLDRSARSYCFTLALHIIDQTLKGMNRPKSFDSYVGSAVSAQMLDELADQLPLILEQTRSIKNGTTTDDDASTALSIIENAIMLDIRVLDQDHKAIEFHKPRGHTTPKKSEKFWRALTRGTASGDQALVTRVLLGARDIVILDKFPPKFTPREPAEPKQFSDVYDERCTSISEFLERVSEFPNFQLAGLFKTPETASSIVHLLFAPDQSVRQGALEIFKAMSGGSGRLEGITYVLESAFHSFLVAFTKSINEISGKNMFPPLPGMIRLCSDVIEALCNSTTGILKLRNLTQQEIDATGEIWTGLWAVLTTIFQHMETWGLQGYDKNYMMEFCRNTMEFADTLFDQYSVFLNALSEDYDDDKQQLEKAKSLLQYPRGAMNTVVRWLRLRDEFLIDKILTLVTSLLARLSKNHINASDAALDYIEEVANKRVRTNLKSTQLALLRDAIDKYTGRQIALKASQEKEKKKAAKQTQLNAWATLGRSRDDAIDLDSDADSSRSRTIADATKNMEKFKQLKAEKDAKKLSLNNKKPAAPAKPVVDRAEFLKKRKLAEEAERKRKAALVAEARGNMPGSAINSVGLATKDHSTKGQGVMVDSDEDSSGSDSDEDSEDEGNPLDRELFGSKKKTAKPANAMSEAEALKKQQAMAGPVKVRKIQRSAKDMRARLAPDLSKLHQEILSWDYFHDGHYPPNTRPEQYQSIPKNVETAEQYMKIFKPLLVLETWSKISSDKNQDSQSRPYEVKVITRASVDAFVEVNTSIPHPTGDQRPEVSEGDLVLLSKEKDPRGSPHAPSCLGRIHKVSRKKQHIEVLYRVMPGNKLMNNLNGGNALNALKVESLITVEREYGALVGLQFYDLNEYIMQAAPSRLLKYAERELAPLMQNYKLNEAQAKAVKSALDNDAFTLIQGCVLQSFYFYCR
jgi:senataxin